MLLDISRVLVFSFTILLIFCVIDVRGRSMTGLEKINQTESNTAEEEVENATVAIADPDKCANLTCQNGGTCKVQQGKPICDCPDGFVGKSCEVYLKHLCSKYKLNCRKTGGSCILDENRQVQCICPEGTEYNHGCHAPNETCSYLKPLCEETRGLCSFDKQARLVCLCPNGTQYGRKSGCITEENVCSKNKPYCEETGGVCVSDEDTEIQCECPKHQGLISEKKLYGHEIGCQTEKDACAYMKPNCYETHGICHSKDKNSEIECLCLNENNYTHGIGCQGNSSRKDWDDPSDEDIDPWDDLIGSKDDGHECLNGGQSLVLGKTFKCMCKKPFTGKFCEKKDRCDRTNCNCPDGYTGRTCEIVLKDLCLEYKPECVKTGGSCMLDERREVQCMCPEGTKYNHGCYAPNETCSHLKPLCEETGGSCSIDKNAKFLCICPNGTRYGRRSGCISKENWCSKNKPNCEETGGVCVSDENSEIQCECPITGKVDFFFYSIFEKIYADEIGCQNFDYLCSELAPNCSETRGVCFPGYKSGEIECICLNGGKYKPGIGCEDDSSMDDGDDPWDDEHDPWIKIIDPWDDERRCLNGGHRYISGNTSKCICEEPFSGKFCEKDPCSYDPCLNNGICQVTRNSFTCICEKPFSGKLCEIDPCSNNPCLNKGICRVTGNSVTCTCKKPFSGKLCENDPCSNNPCLNNGICRVNRNSFICKYEESISGKLSEKALQRRAIIIGVLCAVGGLLCLVGILAFCLIFRRQKLTVNVHQQSLAPAVVNPLETPMRN